MSDFKEGTCQSESVKCFSHPLHARKLLQALNESRKQTQLCDGVVIIGQSSIPVQRNVLSAASPYFRGVFYYEESSESSGNSDRKPSVLDSDEISVETFQLILDYIYISEISLSDDNIQDVLQAADMFLLSDLKDLCCEYLEQCISPSNCLGIQEFAARFSCLWVLHKVTKYIDDHFSEVSFSDEFVKLSTSKLRKLLARDTLQVKSEEDIADSLVRWYQHDPDDRDDVLAELVTCCIRVRKISEKYLDGSVCTDNNLRSSCITDLIIQNKRLVEDAKTRGTTKVLVICGGEGGKEFNTGCEVVVKNNVKCLNLSDPNKRSVQWVELAPMLTPRVVHGLVEAGGFLFAIGGRDNNGYILNSGERYDPVTNTWTPIARMFHARVGFGLVAVDDKIYAIGGSNDMSSPITSAEVYCIYTNKWRELPNMNLKRVWAAYAAADKKIYVMAGGIMGKLYEAVECFDTRSEMWSSVAPMRERRFDARAVGTESNVYVFGGLRRLECPSAMHSGAMMKFCQTEVYSLETAQWSQVMPAGPGLCTMRDNSHVDSALYDGKYIYVIGELDVGGMCHSVRAFNPQTNSWMATVQGKLPNLRSVQCAVIDLPLFMLHSLQWSQEKLLGSSESKQPKLG